ncbi:Dolichol-phosphate mannose synthase subunit 3 [Vitis vinifera]|uniref:Dolichol-phosphate mannose synthase subunit 3 n=1 Tax=Vitis vinifera TaxID=29760 RepID=A0A438F154_VITVI|nr:Dolichol-phosphate mannose synthase subunit 3 [Vitis vinifera]
MKHIFKIMALLVAIAALWIGLLQTSMIPQSYALLLPIYSVVTLGCYGLLMVGVGLMQFPTCPQEALLLQQRERESARARVRAMARREKTKRRKRTKRQGKSFGVESKVFEVEVEKRRGLDQCVKDGKDNKWEKGWKEKGRSYSMVREVNKAGSFIRLGVVDAEEKRYNICIPRGRGGRRDGQLWRRWDSLLVRMEVEGEEISKNVNRLGHCLVGKWNPKVVGGEDLTRLGWLMASVWRLKGKLGLAWLEESQALLEFEHVVEARKVFAAGKRSVGGIQVELELWSPSFGCLEEGEIREEVWVRVKGLPLSLWVPTILRRVGDECGGFVAMDPSTEKMENLQWARILVKMKRGELPSSLEIGIEGIFYNLPLWWEGDGGACAGRQVEEWGSAGLEALPRTTGGMERQLDRTGRVSSVGRIQFGSMIRPSVGGTEDGSSLDGFMEINLGLRRAGGPSLQFLSEEVMSKEAGVGGVRPIGGTKGSKGKEKVLEEEFGPRFGPNMVQRKSSGPLLSRFKDIGEQPGGPSVKRRKGPVESLAQPGLCGEANFELEFLSAREKEAERVQKADLHYLLADSAPSGRSLEGGVPECQCVKSSRRSWALVRMAMTAGSWLSLKAPYQWQGIWRGGHPSMSFKKEGALDWQESSLARFSQFLGFSIEGNVLFRAEGCSQWLSNESQVVELECEGSERKHEKERSGRFLDWKALDACGSAGDSEIVENGVIWVFTGVYGLFTRVERECLWEEVGAIRGIWEGPWCLGGDFNITLSQSERSRQGRITSAMRRFAEVVDELSLVDLQLQGGAFTWSGGLNSQSRARLDRFLVTPCWLDQFSRDSKTCGSKSRGFKDLIRNWWRGIEVSGSASFRLFAKLKELKQKLKVWNREVFGNLECNKEAALQQVEYWDRVEGERSLIVEELACKKEAKEGYAKWVDLEETHWR